MSSSADMSGNGSFDDLLGVFSVAVAEASADAPTDAGADAGQDAVAEPAQSVSANPGGVCGAPRVAHRVAAREPLEVGNVVNSISGLRNQHLFLTYAQCAPPLVWVFAKVGHSRAVTGLAAVQEHHADGNLHIHLYLQKTKDCLAVGRRHIHLGRTFPQTECSESEHCALQIQRIPVFVQRGCS